MVSRHWAFLAAVAPAMLIITSLGAQSQPSLQISSPSSGTIVNPGQTLSVSVTSPSGTVFSQVFAIAEYPIGISTTATSIPTQLSITIPSKGIRIGRYWLTAEGLTPSGDVESPSIAIDVERPDPPISVSFSDSGLILESLGEKISLDVTAIFLDGATQNVFHLKESTRITYSSSNVAVATVDALGNVTAVGPGNAQVMATYTLGSQNFPASVPVTVQTPRLSVSSTSLSFGSQPVGTSSTPQELTSTDTATGNVVIEGVTTSGDFSETDNCTASSPLTPNNGCAVNVTFSPTAGGARGGTLSVSNSTNIVPVTVSLGGAGIVTPFITTLTPASGPAGTSVTVTGVNFGGRQGASTITFNGVSATPTNWSTNGTSIVAPVPSGATTGNVVVTIGGVASNGVSFTVRSIALFREMPQPRPPRQP